LFQCAHLTRHRIVDDVLVSSEVLPPDLAGPVGVALARAATSIPSVAALPGGCVYELKRG